jgi:hypothetical protein
MTTRDITVGDTFNMKFTTRAFATGIPTTMTGTPTIEAYPGNSTTQITAGITLTFTGGFDGVAGLCNIEVVATVGNGFAASTDYALVIAGTAPLVDSVSVLGEVVGHFTTSRSAAAVELANATDGLTAIKADTAAILLDTAEIGTAGDGLSNIGTIATCTTVTNAVTLPAIPTDWITAAGITAAALNGKGDWNVGKTGYSISGTKTTLDALNDISTAQVNTEVDNALNVTTYAEPAQGIPTATTTLVDKIGYLYKVLRNRKTATATLINIYNDNGTTVDHKRTISDDGTTYDEAEIVSGP